jgi:prepilin-type N-terminal cleavage/methylation domain-containing protein
MKKLVKAQSKSGFTLVELMVALLISGILMATVSSVFLMSQKVYSRGESINYKEGTATNTETNLQNLLAVATGVSLESAPKTDDEESYSIGFNADGDCQEYSTTTTVDGGGAKQYSKSVTAIPHLSEIEVEAMNNNITTLNYKLIPEDNTMSTLAGGTVMNNITATNKNLPTQATLVSGTKLKDSGDNLHYLVLTFKPLNGGAVVPGTGINDILKEAGVIVGSWVKMIDYAETPEAWGYRFLPLGAVYTDETGTYVTSKGQYISKEFAEERPTAQTYYTSLGGLGNNYFLKISETTRQITEENYDTGLKAWKVDQYPKVGDLYLYNGDYYIWENKESNEHSQYVPTGGHGWLKLVSAPPEFQ